MQGLKHFINFYLHERKLHPKKSCKHKDQQDPTSKLEIALWFVVTQSGNTSKKWFPLLPTFSKNKQESSDQSQISE